LPRFFVLTPGQASARGEKRERDGESYNVWFIHDLIFSFLVLAFFGVSLLSCHFRPFTDVLRKNFESLTPEVWKF
jgi:hypothetical protein